MSNITVRELGKSRELDREAMSAIRGGTDAWLAKLGSVANVNVNVIQNIAQLQNVQVNALNNVGVIGAGFIPPRLDVSPMQFASAKV